jgi:galactose mutarotase-like enzyme
MPSVYTIASQFLEAQISAQGAELSSLYDKELSLEYLWNGETSYWARRAPILFPIVGKLQNDRYRIGRRYYTMPRHGFARDLEFELLSHRSDEIRLRLSANDETLKVYPFRFVLDVQFKIYGPILTVNYEVKCDEKRDMFFSIGSHPAFNIPVSSGNFSDYYLEFEFNEFSGPYYLEQDLADFDQKPNLAVFQGKRLPFSEKLFERDALIFKDLKSSKLTLKNRVNDREIVIDVGEAPYLGIWKPPGAPFVCVEPWYGVADVIGASDDFLKKEGVIHLEPGDIFRCTYSLHVK